MSTNTTLSDSLQECLLVDRYRLQKQWRQINERLADNKPVDRLQNKFDSILQQSINRVAERRNRLPEIHYPEELPIAQKRDEIASAIDSHQVVIIAGETGSGKTTQLPKICLQLGRGVRGMIGHTQPRRIAARTVAFRIAEELGVKLGESVGYQVRFTDHSTELTHIKLMTDGILLAEIGNDRFLNRYDTLIIDEAHERSLNIDFLLGYLKQLLPRRPDLKVVITSATIDVERLSQHFDKAPVINVSGRTYPVEVRYRPFLEERVDGKNVDEKNEQSDLPGQIVSIIDEIVSMEKPSTDRVDDILVFLAGERDIRETAHAIRKADWSSNAGKQLQVLPLYARLSLAEQEQVFRSHSGRRVVLATNVAETSITVPGIRYVIDPGYARISRYSYRTKVLRLPIEAISQASAEQRKGRCGRVSNGICYRLYSEEDFNSRPEFTEPEILRSNLASVILQMSQLRLGDIDRFPFVDMPDRRLVNDGYKLLEELQALDGSGKLTDIGRRLTQFAVDPRFARMLLAARQLDCLREILIIVSALTIQDPRERPVEKQQAADEKHRRFWHPESDFLALVNLWQYVEEQRQALSQNQLRRLCQREFLSFLRLREWRDLHHQLRIAVKHLDMKENREPAGYEALHRALLSGLLSNIGVLDIGSAEMSSKNAETSMRADKQQQTRRGSAYNGPRNRNFFIFPGSSQFKSQPKWLVAAELIETTKLYAHTVAKIDPEWILSAAQHLVKRSYFEPHYESKRGQVMAFEKVSLYGLTLVEKRRVNYGVVDPPLAREIFIRAALVEGRYRPALKKPPDFFVHNRQLLEETLELEAKARRRDFLVNDEVLFQFFDERIPASVINNRSFDAWRKKAEQKNPQLLFLPRSLVMGQGVEEVTEAQFPDVLQWQGSRFPLSYHFEPGHRDDGVNLHVPIQMLHMVPLHRLEWLVPGLLREKCIALLKALPKQWRKHLVPVPETVDEILPTLKVDDMPLATAVGQAVAKMKGINIPDATWEDIVFDPYYRVNIKVFNDENQCVDSGRDLQQLRERYKGRLQQSLRHVGEGIEQDNIKSWEFDRLPESIQLQKGRLATVGFPSLVDNKSSVSLRLQDSLEKAEYFSQRGLARLLLLENKQALAYLKKNVFKNRDAELRLSMLNQFAQRSLADLRDDVALAAVQQLRLAEAENQPITLPRDRQSIQQLLQKLSGKITQQAQQLEKLVLDLGDKVMEIYSAMSQRDSKSAFAEIKSDIEQQLAQLFAPGFLFTTPPAWLQHYPRYLMGIVSRIEKTDAQIQRDAERRMELQPLIDKLSNHITAQTGQDDEWLYWNNAELRNYRWMLEEFRLSLFAQPMKTSVPVSAKRLEKQWQRVLEH